MSGRISHAIARSLRDFGYPDVTAAMIDEITVAWQRGDVDLPHGVIGMFARKSLEEVEEAGLIRRPAGAPEKEEPKR